MLAAQADTVVLVPSGYPGADVRLNASASDPDGDPVTFAWSAPGVVFDDPSLAGPTGSFPVGTTVAIVVARDRPPNPADALDSLPDSVVVQVAYGPSNLGTVPATLALALAGANPATGRVRLSCGLPETGRVRLTVHDLGGRRVRTLADGAWGKGVIPVEWNGDSDGGARVPSGVYFIRFEWAGRTRVVRVALAR